jgi:hypothetical protein
LFEVADGGTVFLDEIGEVSQATQVKLLRVLDTCTFRRVGSTTEIKVNVRVLAATNRDLEALVRQGLFREDLFYRLSTIALHLPALRERQSDVDLLANHFAAQLNARFGFDKRLSPAALEWLRAHDWPGNVRELRHVLEAAMIVSPEAEIQPAHLPPSVRRSAAPVVGASPASLPTLEELERSHIELVLRATNGHRGQAAAILDISERNRARSCANTKWCRRTAMLASEAARKADAPWPGRLWSPLPEIRAHGAMSVTLGMRPVAARIAGQQRHAGHGRVGADEEIRQRGVLGTTAAPVALETFRGQESGFPGEHGSDEITARQGGFDVLDPVVPYRYLGVDDRIDDDVAAIGGLFDHRGGPVESTRRLRWRKSNRTFVSTSVAPIYLPRVSASVRRSSCPASAAARRMASTSRAPAPPPLSSE